MASRDVPPGSFEIVRDLEIDRDPATVFEFLADPLKFGVVDPALIQVEEGAGS